MRLQAAILLVSLLAQAAPAPKPDPLFRGLVAGNLVVGALDIIATKLNHQELVSGKGYVHEQNGLQAWLLDHGTATYLVANIGLEAALAYGLIRLHRINTTIGRVLAGTTLAFRGRAAYVGWQWHARTNGAAW